MINHKKGSVWNSFTTVRRKKTCKKMKRIQDGHANQAPYNHKESKDENSLHFLLAERTIFGMHLHHFCIVLLFVAQPISSSIFVWKQFLTNRITFNLEVTKLFFQQKVPVSAMENTAKIINSICKNSACLFFILFDFI